MIIIKTKTGDIFVNDKEMVNVTHNRELHTADIQDGKGMGTLWRKPPIEHVESVNYINEQTAKEWKDNGSELEYLHKEMESLKTTDATTGTVTVVKKPVLGADIQGNVYGAGNNAEVTGHTNVVIGKKAE